MEGGRYDVFLGVEKKGGKVNIWNRVPCASFCSMQLNQVVLSLRTPNFQRRKMELERTEGFAASYSANRLSSIAGRSYWWSFKQQYRRPCNQHILNRPVWNGHCISMGRWTGKLSWGKWGDCRAVGSGRIGKARRKVWGHLVDWWRMTTNHTILYYLNYLTKLKCNYWQHHLLIQVTP